MLALCDGNLSTDCKILHQQIILIDKKLCEIVYIAVFIEAITSWWLFQIICPNMCASCLDQLFLTPNKVMHV